MQLKLVKPPTKIIIYSSWLIVDGQIFPEHHCPLCVAAAVRGDQQEYDPSELCFFHYNLWIDWKEWTGEGML